MSKKYPNRRTNEEKCIKLVSEHTIYQHIASNGDEYNLDEVKGRQFTKVFIAVPAIQDPKWRFILAMNGICYPPNWSKINQVAFGREVGDARNSLVDAAIDRGAEYILFLDDDVIVPPNLFVKMLGYKKDIVSGLYVTKSIPGYPLIFEESGDGCYTDWKMGDLVKVWGCGMGATLIDMKVFTDGKLERPFFKTVKLEAVMDPQSTSWYFRSGTEDLYFCDKVKEAGYEVYVDTSIQCLHMDKATGVDYPVDGFDHWYKSKRYIT